MKKLHYFNGPAREQLIGPMSYMVSMSDNQKKCFYLPITAFFKTFFLMQFFKMHLNMLMETLLKECIRFVFFEGGSVHYCNNTAVYRSIIPVVE